MREPGALRLALLDVRPIDGQQLLSKLPNDRVSVGEAEKARLPVRRVRIAKVSPRDEHGVDVLVVHLCNRQARRVSARKKSHRRQY